MDCIDELKVYPDLNAAEIIQLMGDYKTLPISLAIESVKDASQIYRILKNVSKNVFLLESCEDEKNWGRYTFLGFDPKLEITVQDGVLKINNKTRINCQKIKPHHYIRNLLDDFKSPRVDGLPNFTGGLVGYFSYDFIKYNNPELILDAEDEEGFFDLDLMLFDKVIAIDNFQKKIILIVNINTGMTENVERNYMRGVKDLQGLHQLILSGEELQEQKGELLEPLQPLFEKEEFCTMVNEAKRLIDKNEIQQVVLANRLSAKYEGSLFGSYQKLKETNPSPYMFYFSSDDVEIAGASPETLIKLEGTKLSTFPLAGTRPRGKTPIEDKLLEKELLADPKEVSEHMMLVDLGKEDLAKISEPGSVTVSNLMSIQRYSHVMHIGSTVNGTIKNNMDALDALDAVLPAGTLSGTPKIKACEIINQLEKTKRGIYGGAIGYIDFSGNIDVCISIRLAFKKNGKVFVRAGAGIVAESIPENEYTECVNKAKAVVNAL